MTERLKEHELKPRPRAEDLARQRYVLALKDFTGRARETSVRNGVLGRVTTKYRAEHGADPKSFQDIKQDVISDPAYQIWSALNREAQDEMWDSISWMIDADYDRMYKAYEKLSNNPAGGSLTIDDDYVIPPESIAADIHCQPGGFGLDRGDDDIGAGALYEAGGAVYSQGTGISVKETKGYRVIEVLENRFPDFKPTRILELGCSAGGQTGAYASHYPEAEVHAIDASPAHLRYAHGRAESMGRRIHFYAMDVEDLKFPDAHFDLVVSNNLFHEVSTRAGPIILKESYRVLRPGGIVINQDLALRAKSADLYQEMLGDWERDNNGECWFIDYFTGDFLQQLEDADFSKDTIFEEFLGRPASKSTQDSYWYVFGGQKVD
jgi:SAM-dependent methyltransferase